MDQALQSSDKDNERLQRIAERLLVFLYYHRRGATMDTSDLWQSINLWVAISPTEIKEALAILQKAGFIAITRKEHGRIDGPFWYVIAKGGDEAVRLSCERPSIFERPFATS